MLNKESIEFVKGLAETGIEYEKAMELICDMIDKTYMNEDDMFECDDCVEYTEDGQDKFDGLYDEAMEIFESYGE